MPDVPHKNHIVVNYGRYQPPHSGHVRMLNRMRELAAHHGADHMVYLSKSHDKDKNPLSHEQRKQFLEHMAPGINVHPHGAQSMPYMLDDVAKRGYKHVTIVVGKDRVKDVSNLAHKYNEHTKAFDHINVAEGDDRAAGASATKQRAAAKAGDFRSFRRGTGNNKQAREMYRATRRGLGMKAESNRALILVGPIGSGKDMLLRTLLAESNVTEIPMAKLVHHIKTQQGLETIDKGAPVVVNGIADNWQDYRMSRMALEACGYDTMTVYVFASDKASRARNEARQSVGAKTLTEQARRVKWATANKLVPDYQKAGALLFNNSHDLRTVTEEVKEQVLGWMEELREVLDEHFTGDRAAKLKAADAQVQKQYGGKYAQQVHQTVKDIGGAFKAGHRYYGEKVKPTVDEQFEQFLDETKRSEFGANQQLAQTHRMNVVKNAAVKRTSGGMSGYLSYNQARNQQSQQASHGNERNLGPVQAMPRQNVTTGPSSTHMGQPSAPTKRRPATEEAQLAIEANGLTPSEMLMAGVIKSQNARKANKEANRVAIRKARAVKAPEGAGTGRLDCADGAIISTASGDSFTESMDTPIDVPAPQVNKKPRPTALKTNNAEYTRPVGAPAAASPSLAEASFMGGTGDGPVSPAADGNVVQPIKKPLKQFRQPARPPKNPVPARLGFTQASTTLFGTGQAQEEYNKDAVDKAIAASERRGGKVSGRERKLIHALLKGRTVSVKAPQVMAGSPGAPMTPKAPLPTQEAIDLNNLPSPHERIKMALRDRARAEDAGLIKSKNKTKPAKAVPITSDARAGDDMAYTSTLAAEGVTGPTRMDLQNTLERSMVANPGWTMGQHTAHVERAHDVANVHVVHNHRGAPVVMRWDEPKLVYKSLKKLREDIQPRSPDGEFESPEVYEDVGFDSQELMYEGRAVKTNRPFKTQTGYAVYVANDNQVERIDFNSHKMVLQEIAGALSRRL